MKYKKVSLSDLIYKWLLFTGGHHFHTYMFSLSPRWGLFISTLVLDIGPFLAGMPNFRCPQKSSKNDSKTKKTEFFLAIMIFTLRQTSKISRFQRTPCLMLDLIYFFYRILRLWNQPQQLVSEKGLLNYWARFSTRFQPLLLALGCHFELE